jgi:hypothetical protein
MGQPLDGCPCIYSHDFFREGKGAIAPNHIAPKIVRWLMTTMLFSAT